MLAILCHQMTKRGVVLGHINSLIFGDEPEGTHLKDECLQRIDLLSKLSRLKPPPLRLADRRTLAQVFDTTANGGVR